MTPPNFSDSTGVSDAPFSIDWSLDPHDAIEQAYTRDRHYITYVLRKHFGHRHFLDLEGLEQEAFMIAWRNAHNFRGESSVIRWIAGIALHLARKACTRHLQRPSTEELLTWKTPDPADTFGTLEAQIDVERLLNRTPLTRIQASSIDKKLATGQHDSHQAGCAYSAALRKLRRQTKGPNK